MDNRLGIAIFGSLLVALASSLPSSALDTKAIFDRYSDSIVQLRIVEAGSGAKRAIGTAFVVGENGELATNYHVISDLVFEPELYRAEWVDDEGKGHAVALLGFDIVRDIAIVKAGQSFGSPFTLHAGTPSKGERIYAIGDPYDLGMTIVEGLYNGQLEHSRYERIHFTGSLNPGMSGGPALLENGDVIGVNVASSGNQVSFLVPVPQLRRLIDQVLDPVFAAPEDRIRAVRDQLWRHQEDYFGALLSGEIEPVTLGAYSAPSKLAPFFSCWGDVHEPDEALYTALSHQCDTEDWIYVSEKHDMSVVWLRHRQIVSDELPPGRFYQLYTQFFEDNWSRLGGDGEMLTDFRCRTRFVDSGGLVFKTAFCARRYIELEGLYDVVFKAAHLGEDAMGIETALVATSISLENATRLARRYLSEFKWNE